MVLHLGTNFIGRSEDNDMQLETELVSRRHAKLIVTEKDITVHDLDSHNGIFVNGKKVRSERLRIGDKLYLADAWVLVEEATDVEDVNAASFNENSLVRDVLDPRPTDPALQAMNVIYRATRLLTAPRDVRLDMLALGHELTSATSSYLVENQNGTLSIVGSEGNDDRAIPVLQRVVHEGVSLFAENSVICVPVLSQDAESLGAIYLSSQEKNERFSTRALETVTTLAHLLGQRWDDGESTRIVASTTESGEVPLGVSALESAALNDQIVVLESELARAREGAKVFERERDELLRLKSEAASTISGAEKERLAALEKTKTLEQENTTLKSGIRELQQALGEVEKQNAQNLAGAQSGASMLEKNIAALQSKDAETNAKLQKALAERDAFENTFEALEEELAQANSSLQKTQEEQAALLKTLQNSQNHERELEETMASRESELTELSERVPVLERLASLVSKEFAGPTASRLQALAAEQELGPSAKAGELLVVALHLANFDNGAHKQTPEDVMNTMALFANTAREKAPSFYGSVAHQFGSTIAVVFDPAGLPQAIDFSFYMQEIMKGVCELKMVIDVGAATQVFVGPHACTSVLVGEPLLTAKGALDFAKPNVVLMTKEVNERLVGAQQTIALGLYSVRGRPIPVELFELHVQPKEEAS